MRSFLLSALTLACLTVQSQELTSYGQLSIDEFKIKTCAFDADANAVILVREGVSLPNDSYNLVTYHYVRLKILNEKGMDYADAVINYYSKDEYEFIDDIEGTVYNMSEDGVRTTTRLERKSIFDRKVNNIYSQVKLAFPNVHPGSIIEYRYRSTMKSYGGLEDWDFQERLPVYRSTYNLTVHPKAEFAYSVQKRPDYNVDIQSGNGAIKFEMKNIPALLDEPYMDARKDYLQRVVFQLSGFSDYGGGLKKYLTSWAEVSRELNNNENFGRQLDNNLSSTEDFIKIAKLIQDPKQKMKTTFEFVRKNMNWNGFYGIYTSSVKSAWNKKTGSTGDVNLILVNLLRAVGLNADPILVSEREHGRVSVQYPFIDQFNEVLAVVTIGNQKYYLDATDSFTPPDMIPNSILNTTGYIVNRKNGGLVTIEDNDMIYLDSIRISAKLGADGVLRGETNTSSLGYARVSRIRAIKRNAKEYADNQFAQFTNNLTIADYSTENESNDSLALKHAFKFTLPATSSGEFTFVPLNLFSGIRKNPFLADNRFSNINFGYKQNISFLLEIDVPAEFTIEELPKSVRMVTADRSIDVSRIVRNENGKKVIVQLNLIFTRSLFDAEEYPDVQIFYKKLYALINEQMLLKKK